MTSTPIASPPSTAMSKAEFFMPRAYPLASSRGALFAAVKKAEPPASGGPSLLKVEGSSLSNERNKPNPAVAATIPRQRLNLSEGRDPRAGNTRRIA